jgi:hypothetical protein
LVSQFITQASCVESLAAIRLVASLANALSQVHMQGFDNGNSLFHFFSHKKRYFSGEGVEILKELTPFIASCS